MTDPNKIEADRKVRHQLLLRAYETWNQSQLRRVYLMDVCPELGIPIDAGFNAFEYLKEEELITTAAVKTFRITHKGIKAIEASIDSAKQATDPVGNQPPLIQNFHAPVAAVQVGSNNTAVVKKTSDEDA